MSHSNTPPALPPRRPQSISSASTSTQPPIPPRPLARAASKRKPVPVHDPNDLITASQTSSPVARSPNVSTTNVANDHHLIHAPSLPPRPGAYQLNPALPTFHHNKESTTTTYHHAPVSGRGDPRRGFVSGEKRRKKRWLIIGGLMILLIVIIVAVVAATVSKGSGKRGKSTSLNTDNGGHPLSIEDGGVDIGQPGDIARYGPGSSDHFVLQMDRSTVVSRFDPIVAPGKVSSHVHRFYGSSLADEVRRNASEAITLGKCSTTPVQDDHSQYWVPQLYWHSPDNGSFTMVPIRYHAAYYFQKAPTGETIHPFPDNYNVVAGNPFRREVDPNDM